jgi:hypothetical protein
VRVALIVGQSNAGKTLLMIRLAERFGIRSLRLESGGCEPLHRRFPADLSTGRAVEVLTGPALNQTRSLQGVSLPGSVRRGLRFHRVRIVDSVGLSDRIHPDAQIRKGMADTLRELRRASIILHVVDAERISSAGLKRGFAEVDYQVMQYGCANGRYAMIVNKADLPGASRGVAELRNGFPAVRMIPVSARTGLGLDKVKRFIRTSV